MALPKIKLRRTDSIDLEVMTQKLLKENPAPFVTAQSWVLYDQKESCVLFGKCEAQPRQIASLTKIMTATIVLDLLKYFKSS